MLVQFPIFLSSIVETSHLLTESLFVHFSGMYPVSSDLVTNII